MGFTLKIAGLNLFYADGSKEVCKTAESQAQKTVFKCDNAVVEVSFENGLIGVEVTSLKPLNSFIFGEISLEIGVEGKVFVLTLHPDAGSIYSQAFGYYNPLAVDREPRVPKPSDSPQYPPQFSIMSHIDYARRFPCWTYPVVTDVDNVPSYSVFALGRTGNAFAALLTLSNGDVTAYLGPGLRVSLFLGKERYSVRKSWAVSIAVSNNPYDAVKQCILNASKKAVLKLRVEKKKPFFVDKLGWCSWNALLTDDLSHDNVVKIVKGLLERGVPIKWVIIDDGWQNEVRRGDLWFARILKTLGADANKFPRGLSQTVEELKKLGIEFVGLWHTINVHWGGFEKSVVDEIGVEGHRFTITNAYVPPPQLEKAVNFYTKFLNWVKGNGFDMVKVDNQWVIHALYWGEETVGEVAKNIQIALQVAAKVNGLEILNCMSMAPEDYSNYFLSNAMRVSMDYIPFWKADAKLHTMFSVYNSLLFSHIAYPDYDMWMSYDPYALVHAIARVFSGGPIYITDRHPEKTNVELLKRIVLPNGETVKVDEPGLPTKDILFKDPYNEKTLLKIASKVGNSYVIALVNVNREGVEIEESIGLDIMPYSIQGKKYAYYMVLSNKMGVVESNEKISVKLKELEAEIIVFAPIENEKSVIGLKEYLLPPYPIEIHKLNNKLIIKSKASGTLLYYVNGQFKEMYVSEKHVVEI
ncbi:Sip1-related alpha-galactosidase [Ignisphaera sp. 4213-co]|uniref:Sip1-related alpha-galactosidase n=1 Tax=Ignisphaera cupida TaxID=3050454 RepID=A0ABD4Z6J8_9CREN|nr:Sip1-related alpha-galactosidase [Ignisphaera sp. 4213-co]MDK6028951.1 Sip1-related alpha-galactosidase [Ignisphaera sp. 4213-co]